MCMPLSSAGFSSNARESAWSMITGWPISNDKAFDNRLDSDSFFGPIWSLSDSLKTKSGVYSVFV